MCPRAMSSWAPSKGCRCPCTAAALLPRLSRAPQLLTAVLLLVVCASCTGTHAEGVVVSASKRSSATLPGFGETTPTATSKHSALSASGRGIALPAAATCTDKVMLGHSIYQGGVLAASANVTDQASCCALCHGDYHDECQGWEWVNTSVVHERGQRHNCDVFAKAGLPAAGWPGRVSGLGSNAPPPAPPPGPGPAIGGPCHSDGDCEASWSGPLWRCLEDHGAAKSVYNGCHMHATTTNTTCACQRSGCGGGVVVAPSQPDAGADSNSTKLLVIGDSISMGMQHNLATLMRPDGWVLSHNPGNGDNTNYGAHCVPAWTSGTKAYEVISFQFGLHDIAHDEERLSVQQYSALLTNITAHLVAVHQSYGTKLLWVKTTPVPSVPTYGMGCNGSATSCLNPARFDADVVQYNAAADEVMAAANAKGAKIATADLYSFVLAKCGGQGYHSCPGFQLPMNVHYTPAGWEALAAEMRRALLALKATS